MKIIRNKLLHGRVSEMMGGGGGRWERGAGRAVIGHSFLFFSRKKKSEIIIDANDAITPGMRLEI